MSKSPTLSTVEGRAELNKAVDFMIKEHANLSPPSRADMAVQSAILRTLFSHKEIADLFIIVINRLAGHDTNVS